MKTQQTETVPRDDRSINDLVNEGLVRWAKLVGVNLDKARTLGDYHLRGLLEDLNESRELDPSGLTTFMLLRGLTEYHLKESNFTTYDLILEPARVEEKLSTMRAMRDLIEDPQVVSVIADFQKQLQGAADLYGPLAKILIVPGAKAAEQRKHGLEVDRLPETEFKELLDDKYQLAFIRRDALRSMERLQAHQFTQGQKDPEPLKLNRKVWEFWNVNSFVLAMQTQQVGGITLGLLRDPEQPLNSYFVFGARNGETITILTDMEEGPHPLYQKMSRRPDRNLESRAAKNWFPYHLLDLSVSADQKELYAKQRKALVPINARAAPLCNISELHAEEFVWLILLTDLIREKFWAQDFKLPELSYTGSMVKEPALLVGSSALMVKEGKYKPLELPKLTKEAVSIEATKEQFERPSTGFNLWMEERFEDKISDEYLNAVGDRESLLLTERAVEEGILKAEEHFGKRELPVMLEGLNPMTFGSKEKLERDRKWIGRVNKLKLIQQKMEQEYKEKHEEVFEWLEKKVKANDKALLLAAAKGEWKVPCFESFELLDKDDKTDSFKAQIEKTKLQTRNALHQYAAKWPKDTYGAIRLDKDWVRKERANPWRWKPEFRTYQTSYLQCYLTGKVATVFTTFEPSCPEGIAALCGVEVKELPIWLQHWYSGHEPYSGNHILNRIEPSDWVLDNSWNRNFRVKVILSLSKKAFNQLLKEHGFPARHLTGEKDDG